MTILSSASKSKFAGTQAFTRIFYIQVFLNFSTYERDHKSQHQSLLMLPMGLCSETPFHS
jgi:hypothetical protein